MLSEEAAGAARTGVDDSRRLSGGWVLTVHVLCAVLIQGTWSSASFLMPVIVKKSFDGEKYHALTITVAPLVLLSLSIFWAALLARVKIGRYLLVYFACGLAPVGMIAMAQNLTQLIALYCVAAVGVGAWSAVQGELIRRLYPSERSGKAFGILTSGIFLFGALVSLVVGNMLKEDPKAFRVFLPVMCGMQLAGVVLLGWLARRAGAERAGSAAAGTISLGATLRPILHMGEVLKRDRVFFRYEAAFMTYGVGWMICWALVPLLCTEVLKLNYGEISESTAAAYQFTLALVTLPLGYLSDRIGPARLTAACFAGLTLYPVLLILTGGAEMLMVASVVHGIFAAGVNVGWLLGPVSLAPTREMVPQYVAIHASLVGLRGAVFQLLGVGLYAMTGRMEVPLVIAALGFAWAGYQMAGLWREMRQNGRGPGGAVEKSGEKNGK